MSDSSIPVNIETSSDFGTGVYTISSSLKTPSREERNKCWEARDQLYKCLESESLEAEETHSHNCKSLESLLLQACPESWAKHFIDKHKVERMRAGRLERLGAKSIAAAIKDGDIIATTK